MKDKQPHHKGVYRRTRWTAVGALGAVVATFALSGPSAASPRQTPSTATLEPGVGLAIAETQRVDPRAGGLSLGITTGRSIAGHQNTVAQASSQAVDFGIIGQTMAARGCDGGDPSFPAEDQPSAIQVDSRDQNSTQDADEDKLPIPAHKHASANPAPYGEAITTTGPLSIAGLINVGGGVATTTSGLVDLEDGSQMRQARAVTDISEISIPLAQVTLSSLHWEAISDSVNGVQGIFSIGAAKIAGNAIPTNNPAETLVAINAALQPLGFAIAPPTTRVIEANHLVFVDPLGISIFPSAQRDQLAGALIVGAQPAREDVFAFLLEKDCGNATYITIFDVALGSVTGAGSLSLVLGGVQASSGESIVNQFVFGGGSSTFPGVSLPGTSNSGVLGATNTNSTFTPSAASTGAAAPTAVASPAAPSAAATPASSTKELGKRGGALASVGLAGLGALALVAEGDRRKMRRAQKEIPQFEE